MEYKITGARDLKRKIEKTLLGGGAALVGFARMEGITHDLGRGIISGISIAAALDPYIMRSILDGPTREYYGEYLRINKKLSQLAGTTADILRQNGFQAVVLEPSGDISKFSDLCSPMPHKTVATRAGLGWIGKTALLVTPQFGSAVRLNSVLTDMKLDETAEPVTDSRCGDCNICVDECPGGAASGLLLDTYQAGVPGGTGESFDWTRVTDAHERGLVKPIVLAGGLNPANVVEAIAIITPYAVDVSGGVESQKGIKDHEKMAAFVEAVRTADGSH